jgi:sulfoxide reductase heme-binding subunit YedZ
MSPTLLRRILKPLVFIACLLPFAWLIVRAFGLVHTGLGADPVKKIQDTCGEWGLRFLMITLAITPLRDWFGATWLISLRRMLGLYAFFYVLLHFLTWFVLNQGMDWQSMLTDIVKRPYITIGFTALVLLIPLAVTSTNAMMRRLGKRWKQLHRFIYPICILAVWHYYWQVKADVREPLVYVAIVALLLGWRVWKSRFRRNTEITKRDKAHKDELATKNA